MPTSEYYQEHKEKILEQVHKYQDEHKEQKRASHKRWRIANPDKMREIRRRKYAKKRQRKLDAKVNKQN